MGSATRWVRTAGERARRLYAEIGSDLRLSRESAGLSQAQVARRIGVSQMQVSRVERGVARVSLEVLAAFAAVVGSDLAARCFPAGPPLRDRAQLAILAKLHATAPRLGWAVEVPVPVMGDRRAIDTVGRAGGRSVGAELESRLRDWQGVARRTLLKQRDAGLDAMLIVLPDTHHNRDAIAAAGIAVTAAFPLGSRAVLAALRAGRVPAGNGVLFLRGAPLHRRRSPLE